MRNANIDSFRVISICAVILIHTAPFKHLPYVHVAIDQGSRFGVSFFFVASGYFAYKSFSKRENLFNVLLGKTKFLLSTYLLWYLVYLFYKFFEPLSWDIFVQHGLLKLISNYWSFVSSEFLKNPYEVLLSGPGFHLWFLPSLWMGLVALAAGIYFQAEGIFFIYAVALYIFGVLGGSYSDTSVGFKFLFWTRMGPFFSTLLIALGAIFCKYQIKLKLRYAVAIFLFGLLCHFSEVITLNWMFGTNMTKHDFVFGTVFMGTGAMLMALALPKRFEVSILVFASRYVLGIYVVHLLVMNLLLGFNFFKDSNFILPVSVFFVSLGFSFGVEKIRSEYRKAASG